ncbi:MAG: hypothetical protein ACYTXY_36605, partial [Nostoc sp.]
GLTESEIEHVQTPEFRVTGADGVTRLAEVKTIEGPLVKNGIKRNLTKAFSQIKAQAKVTHETGAYIRIDASNSKSTTLTRDEISRYVKGDLSQFAQKGGDYVEFVEVLYNDTEGQSQKLLFQLQKGNIVISP